MDLEPKDTARSRNKGMSNPFKRTKEPPLDKPLDGLKSENTDSGVKRKSVLPAPEKSAETLTESDEKPDAWTGDVQETDATLTQRSSPTQDPPRTPDGKCEDKPEAFVVPKNREDADGGKTEEGRVAREEDAHTRAV
jgi:hypothetical protein